MKHEAEKQFINLIYNKYIDRKSMGTLQYGMDNQTTVNIIRFYYKDYERTSINQVIQNFRMRYMVNETVLEKASSLERLGLGDIYNYIQDYPTDKNFSIFEIFKISQLLFSHCPYGERIVSFRQGDVYLPGSGIEIPSYGEVQHLIIKLGDQLNELQQSLNQKDFDIIEYLKKAIQIKAELVRIHPFDDGNGRISRAMLNLMFKKAGIPLVYVVAHEKEEYGKAMNKAIVSHDFEHLYNFYFDKICESIYELDIEPNLRPVHHFSEIKR